MNLISSLNIVQVKPLMENTLIITIGISGSGKSTYVKQHFHNSTIVSTDAIRLKLTGDINNQTDNKQVFKLAFEALKLGLLKSDVVFDATNVELFYLDNLITEVGPKKIKFLVFETDKETCKERVKADLKNNIIRSDVPDQIIDNQYEYFKKTKEFLKYYSNDIIWINNH